MSDLISRQAAIDALAQVARETFNLSDEFNQYLAGLMDGENAIRQLPSAWIPVTERLPEASGAYLVTCANGNVKVGHFATFDGKWTDAKAVAWVPLPEAYEGGNGHGEQ